jgi:serine/threonine protein kinase, bacterial
MCDPPWEGSPVVEHFGPYRLDELIGRGGMGEVFRAFDTLRKRTVALKRLRPSLLADPEFQARFRAESELAARLRSAHVIPIHDYGEIDGRLYIDMRLVDGEDMGDRLTARGAMPPADVVDVLGQIAGALDAAHAAGLVHRDVKPSNVLLSPADGVSGRDFAYLVDFGIARAADGTGALTGSGPIVGTVDYMAPERFERRSPDHRVDVYALACVMFEALTGMKPFVTDSLAGLLYSHLHEPPPRPSVRRPGVSAAFDAVIARGMAKDPDQRFPTAGALAAAARVALEQPAEVVLPVLTPAAPAGRRRRARPDTEPTRDLRTVAAGLGPGEAVPVSRTGPLTRRGWLVAGLSGLAAAVVATGGVLASRGEFALLTPAASGPQVVRVAGVLPIGFATGLAVAPSGRYYVTGRSDRTPTTEPGLQVEAYTGQDPTPVGTAPLPEENVSDLAIAADGSRLAVTSQSYESNVGYHTTLTVVDPNTTAVLASAQLPDAVGALALAPDGARAYLVVDHELQVRDTADGTLLTTLPLGASAKGVAVTPDGHSVLVTCSTGLKIIDATRGEVQQTIGLRDEPSALAITPDGLRALVLTSQNKALATVDLTTRTVTGAVEVGESPADVAVTPDGAQALVTNGDTGTVTGLNLADGTRFTLSVGDRPSAVAVSSDGTFGLVVTSTSVVRLERGPA